MARGSNVSNQMEYMLATGNLISKTGLGLMQVRRCHDSTSSCVDTAEKRFSAMRSHRFCVSGCCTDSREVIIARLHVKIYPRNAIRSLDAY